MSMKGKMLRTVVAFAPDAMTASPLLKSLPGSRRIPNYLDPKI
jgi:hypothetical protein